MNFDGIVIGGSAFIIIGMFHPIVIKSEYLFGTRIWPLFLLSGISALALSLYIDMYVARAILGVTGFSILWSIKELFEQKKRVEKGWFPKKSGRKRIDKK